MGLLRTALGFGKQFVVNLFKGKGAKAAQGATTAGTNQAGKELSNLRALHATGKLSDEALETGLNNVVGASAAGSDSALKGIGKGLALGAVVAGGDFLLNGKDGFVGGAADFAWTELGKFEAEQNTIGKWHGFLKGIQEFLHMIGIEWDYLDKKLEDHGKKDSLFTYAKDKVGGATATVAGVGVGAYALKNKLGGGSNPTLKSGGTSSAQLDLFDKAPKAGSGSLMSGIGSKLKGIGGHIIGKSGRFLGSIVRKLPFIGAIAAVGTVGLATMDTAEAAEALDAANVGIDFQKSADVPDGNLTGAEIVDAKETELGSMAISSAAASGVAGLVTTFALASNPIGWAATAGIIATSVAVGFASEFAAKNITVDNKGTSLSQWTGNKLSNAWRSTADWTKEAVQKIHAPISTHTP